MRPRRYCARREAWLSQMGVASMIWILPRIFYACTPADKVKLVNAAAGPVLFIGDGVNDAPALAAADCGISVAGAHGAATQTADVVIVNGGVGQLVPATALARRMVSITRQNLGFAVVYNLIALPLAVAGVLSPSMAAFAMLASSSSVAFNSLRLELSGTSARPIGAAPEPAELSDEPAR